MGERLWRSQCPLPNPELLSLLINATINLGAEMIGKLLGFFFKREEPLIVEEDKWSLPAFQSASENVRTQNPLKGRIRIPLKGNGAFAFDIVGEASYQVALETLAGKKTREGKEVRCTAKVSREPANLHDPNAVKVEIGGKTVGYFSRADAKDYTGQLQSIGGGTCEVAAMIVGGFKSKTKEGHYGVKLDITRHL